jgi:chemotaxis protein MotB
MSVTRRFAGLVALAAAAGCVMDGLVEEQESEIRAVRSEIEALEARLDSLRAESQAIERRAGPEAVRLRRAALERDLQEWGLRVTSRGPELVVTLASTVLFKPGDAKVRKEATGALAALAGALAERFPDRAVRVEGHTDSTAPRRVAERFPTNWELSAARSLAVLRFLVDEGKLPRGRCFAAAYGEHRPVAENSTADGRERNRRVDIVILPPVGVERVTTAELLP